MRKGVLAASWCCGCTGPSALGQTRVRVLTYHRFGHSERDPFCVDPQVFESHIAYIARHNLAISLTEFQAFLAGSTNGRDGAVLVTIDDGFRSTYSVGMPILRQYGVPAVAFVVPGLLRTRTGMAQRPGPEPYMTWDELAALPGGGIDIGSHGFSHRSLGRLSTVEIEQEARRSRAELEERLAGPVTAFAYPYGTRSDFSAATAEILRSAGYTCIFTSQHGSVRVGVDTSSLPRIKVEGGEPFWFFRLLLKGGMDNWCWVDRMFHRWQASDLPPE